MDIRLIAFDMDGTLLDANGVFPEVNVRRCAPVQSAAFSWRSTAAAALRCCASLPGALGVAPYIISVNGARVDKGPDGPTLAERVYDEERTRAVYEAMRDSGMYYTVYTRGHTFMGNSDQRRLYSRFGHHYAHTSRSGDYLYEMVDDEARLRSEGAALALQVCCPGKRARPPL